MFADIIWTKLARISVKKINLSTIDPMVSFTFDDAPLSAFTNGGKILETHGFRGTYYVSAGLIGSPTAVGQVPSLDIIRDFHERGHEIGNHTYDHLDCRKTSFWGIVKSIRRNSTMLSGMMSGSFAYPYGAVNDKSRVATRVCTTSARGTCFGLNRNMADITTLKSVSIYDFCGVDKCIDLVKECAEEGGWLIFYTHDVCDKPSDFGCTPEQLNRVVSFVNERNLNVTTVGKALRTIERLSRE